MPRFLLSTQTNPYLNIAVEQYLLAQPSDGDLTFYLWAVTAVFFVVGAFIFKRLKIHFADTL